MSEEEKPPAWAQTLQASVTKGLETLTSKVDILSENVELLQHDAKDTRLRLGRMERELDEVKDRQANASMRVRAESDVNLKQDSAIAEILVKVESIEQKTDAQTAILSRLESGAKALIRHPKVQLAGGIIWTALLMYAASKGWVSK